MGRGGEGKGWKDHNKVEMGWGGSDSKGVGDDSMVTVGRGAVHYSHAPRRILPVKHYSNTMFSTVEFF